MNICPIITTIRSREGYHMDYSSLNIGENLKEKPSSDCFSVESASSTVPSADQRMSLSGNSSLLLQEPPPPLSPPSASAGISKSCSAANIGFVNRHAPKSRSARTATFSERRKAFLGKLTRPSPYRGYVMCRICAGLVWGPNGRYHMEKCAVLCEAREKAKEEGIVLHSICGIRIDEELFKRPKAYRPKPAKLAGFVVSSTVSIGDCSYAPTLEERKQGMRVGKKGWVRCLTCNAEIYAPNARHHKAACHNRESDTSE